MSQPITEVLPNRLADHRAVKMWSLLRPERLEPAGIDILEVTKKTCIYRLSGVGPGGRAVIAKRCGKGPGAVERTVYQAILPRLTVPALRCHGYVEEAGGEFCWLFLDEALGVEYSPRNKAHCGLTARWLAALHGVPLDDIPAWCLPDRGPRHYLDLLRSARATVVENLANPVLPVEDRQVLQSLAREFDLMEFRWEGVEALCEHLPRTLVHGDLVAKNVRVQQAPDGPALLVFDWENAGRGVAIADLAQFLGRTVSPDLRTYCEVRSASVRSLDLEMIRRLAAYGGLFRLLDAISWSCPGLSFGSYRHLEKPMSYLRVYEQRMHEALESVGWAH